MNKLSYQEILEILKTICSDVDNLAFDDYDADALHLALGEMQTVDEYGGEGQGDDWWSILYFKDHDVYIRIDGYYSSMDGTQFDGWDTAVSEVRPAQKTITVYESITTKLKI